MLVKLINSVVSLQKVYRVHKGAITVIILRLVSVLLHLSLLIGGMTKKGYREVTGDNHQSYIKTFIL